MKDITSIINFVNHHLCPLGIITKWHETIIVTAYKLGDYKKIEEIVESICMENGVAYTFERAKIHKVTN